ncbi:MAG TPA: hypothetical protein VGW38_20700 [Chloroflexota bacterium]|nr:hypothetical protein [Chloroflexota bacterium]
MQQQIQTNQSAEQVLNDAASFFSKRRAKILERGAHGFRFGLPGSSGSGSITVDRASGASATTVTVEAEDLSIMAIAEGFVRELRKQARDAGRQAKAGATNTVALSDLRQRLGMPEPRVRPVARPGQPGQPGQRPPGAPAGASAETSISDPGVAAAEAQTAPTPAGPPPAMSNAAQANMPSVTGAPMTLSAEAGPPTESPLAGSVVPPGGGGESPIPGASAGPGALSVQATAPDGPAPIEAAQVTPEGGPQSAPTGQAAVEAAHPSFEGPVPSSEQRVGTTDPASGASAGAFASAEQTGGVPQADEVVVETEPVRPNPGTPAGSSGAATELGPEASTTRE